MPTVGSIDDPLAGYSRNPFAVRYVNTQFRDNKGPSSATIKALCGENVSEVLDVSANHPALGEQPVHAGRPIFLSTSGNENYFTIQSYK